MVPTPGPTPVPTPSVSLGSLCAEALPPSAGQSKIVVISNDNNEYLTGGGSATVNGQTSKHDVTLENRFAWDTARSHLRQEWRISRCPSDSTYVQLEMLDDNQTHVEGGQEYLYKYLAYWRIATASALKSNVELYFTGCGDSSQTVSEGTQYSGAKYSLEDQSGGVYKIVTNLGKYVKESTGQGSRVTLSDSSGQWNIRCLE